MLKTSLYDQHQQLGAKIVDFAGWQMPIQYKNLKEEVLAIRKDVGVFDVSHMGEFFITGPETEKFLDELLPNDIAKAKTGKAIYSPLLRKDGTIIDDLIVYKIADDKMMICVNASNIEKDFKWIAEQAKSYKVEVVNKSQDYSLLAIQGPNSLKALKAIDITSNIKDIDYYSIQVEDDGVIYARTGYTGEDGFEVFGGHEFIQTLWSKLMENNIKPCGLGARDVLRLEVCYPLYGNELNDTVTPLECGLKWTTKLDKNQFIGKEALLNQSPKSRLIKISLEKGIPRTGYKVLNEQGIEIGSITSGSMSVMLEKGIAIARVDKSIYNNEEKVSVEIRSKIYPAHVTKKAFYNGGHK